MQHNMLLSDLFSKKQQFSNKISVKCVIYWQVFGYKIVLLLKKSAIETIFPVKKASLNPTFLCLQHNIFKNTSQAFKVFNSNVRRRQTGVFQMDNYILIFSSIVESRNTSVIGNHKRKQHEKRFRDISVCQSVSAENSYFLVIRQIRLNASSWEVPGDYVSPKKTIIFSAAHLLGCLKVMTELSVVRNWI